MRKAGFLLFGLAGALVLSQFPEFFQQYTQRLGGRLDEVAAQVTALEQRAAEAGKDVPGYLRGFLLHRDVDVRREGMHLRSLVERRATLADAYEALTGADSLWRGPRFVEHLDWEVTYATLTVYRPAVPVTAESAVYTGTGFGAGVVVFLVILGLWGGPERRDERRPRGR
jgi:hypothetical protein